jgi:DNA replication and repair protein RecF
MEVEINPGRSQPGAREPRARLRAHGRCSAVRSVLFAPEDLALVKGDPAARRRFIDDLLVQRQPRWAGVRADYDRILKQRSALLKSAAPRAPREVAAGARRAGGDPRGRARRRRAANALHTLDVWDGHLAALGAQLLYARLRLLRDLRGHLREAPTRRSAGVRGRRR